MANFQFAADYAVASSLLPDSLLETAYLELQVANGIFHLDHSRCADDLRPVLLSCLHVTKLPSNSRCHCLNDASKARYHITNRTGATDPVLTAAFNAAIALNRADTHLAHSPSSLLLLPNEVNELLVWHAALAPPVGLSTIPSSHQVLNNLVELLRNTIAEVQSSITSPTSRQQVDRLIYFETAKSNRRTLTPTLVGIAHWESTDPLVDLLVTQRNLRPDPATAALIIPAYVNNWLRSHLVDGSIHEHVTLTPSDQPEIAETAALLWEPLLVGPLDRLETTLMLARSL